MTKQEHAEAKARCEALGREYVTDIALHDFLAVAHRDLRAALDMLERAMAVIEGTGFSVQTHGRIVREAKALIREWETAQAQDGNGGTDEG